MKNSNILDFNSSELQLIIFKEHTIGYMRPVSKLGLRYLEVLHTSILKGSSYSGDSGPILINNSEKQFVRLAISEDVDNYGIYNKGYFNYDK